MKARFKDATSGATLWLKDHGSWKAVTVAEVRKGGKGHKVVWTDAEGNPGKSALETLYVQPKD